MVLLRGKTLVKCPKKGEEVSVNKECSGCKDFKHICLESYTLIVACKHGEAEKPEEPEETKEEEFEEEK